MVELDLLSLFFLFYIQISLLAVVSLVFCSKSDNSDAQIVGSQGSATNVGGKLPGTQDSLMNVAVKKDMGARNLDEFDSERVIVVEDDDDVQKKPPLPSKLTPIKKTQSMSAEDVGAPRKRVRFADQSPNPATKTGSAEALDVATLSPSPSQEFKSPVKAMFRADTKLSPKRSSNKF